MVISQNRGDVETLPESYSGLALQPVVLNALRDLGLNATAGPDGEHEGLVTPPAGVRIQNPLVLEIKSSTKAARSYLRLTERN